MFPFQNRKHLDGLSRFLQEGQAQRVALSLPVPQCSLSPSWLCRRQAPHEPSSLVAPPLEQALACLCCLQALCSKSVTLVMNP